MNDETTPKKEPYTLSNSEIQVFKDCRRKWWLGYYRRLQPKQKQFTGALALGSRIHEALDIHYSTGKDLLEAHAELVKRDIDALAVEYRDWETDRKSTRLNSSHRL